MTFSEIKTAINLAIQNKAVIDDQTKSLFQQNLASLVSRNELNQAELIELGSLFAQLVKNC